MQALDPALQRFVRSAEYPSLRLLVLFGSRARGEAAVGADWDVEYVAADEFRPDELLAERAMAVERHFRRVGERLIRQISNTSPGS